jgi:hypothetical protein
MDKFLRFILSAPWILKATLWLCHLGDDWCEELEAGFQFELEDEA